MRQHYLNLGQLFAHHEPHLITTVLGSCVAVCLWDARRGIGGMNHYMIPHWGGKGLPSPRYGNVAIPRLIELVEGLGARRGSLVAKVFGGGNVLGSGEPGEGLSVGLRNADYALHALDEAGIPVAAGKLRPSHGLKVSFDTHSGEVLVRRVRSIRDRV